MRIPITRAAQTVTTTLAVCLSLGLPIGAAAGAAVDPTVPERPVVTGSTPGAGSVTVDFAPAGDGGSPITSYTAQCHSTDGGATKTATGAASPIVVAALTGVKAYHCRVRATNAVGTGKWSAYGATVSVPAGPPTAPAAPLVKSSTGVGGGVRVAFVPKGDGGSPITGYTAQCQSADGGVTKTASGAASPLTVTGLTLGKSYQCRVRATNALGNGPWSAVGETLVVFATRPQAPTVTLTEPFIGDIRVHFVANGDGGAPIHAFAARCFSTDGGAPSTLDFGPTAPLRVGHLTSGKTYHCQASAANAVGTSAWSAFGELVVAP